MDNALLFCIMLQCKQSFSLQLKGGKQINHVSSFSCLLLLVLATCDCMNNH